jgi:hypothetical protein
MIQPKQKSTQGTQHERANEKQAERRDSYQAHQKETKNYDQTDGMPRPFTSAVTAEGHNLDGVRFGAAGRRSPPGANLQARGKH